MPFCEEVLVVYPFVAVLQDEVGCGLRNEIRWC